MAFNESAINLMLDAIGVACDWAGLLGSDGSTEVTGGSPAYARKAVTWAAASGSSMSANGTLPTFDVPADTVTKVILCTESTAGTTHIVIDVTDEVFAAQGTYELTAITLSGS
jgi:hypothetical protein